MLRSLVLILLIVNAAFFSWSKGWLNQIVGVQPDSQHEPQRMGLQIHAEQISVLRPGASPTDTAYQPSEVSLPAAANAPSTPHSAPPTADATQAGATSTDHDKRTKCMEAGPFNASEYASLEAGLKPILPAGSWASRTVAIQGLWLVYMGPYADADMLERKQIELSRIKGLSFEEVSTPAHLALGISLGRFKKQEDADAGLNAVRSRGIRTARIVTLRPAMDVQVLRIPHASVSTRAMLASMKLPQGKGFSACKP